MSVDHYENFPVASLLCPPELRAPVTAIYWFARTADDIADEGEASPQERALALAEYRTELLAVAGGAKPTARWLSVFAPLQLAITHFALPVSLLEALLSAFEQDLVKRRYADRLELVGYCERSANPVGRLLLHLHGVSDAAALAQSDAICTSLQLINFWQDMGIDIRRDRLYLPLEDCEQHALDLRLLMAGSDSPPLRATLAAMVEWSRSLMAFGAPLVHRLPGRSGWELRLVVQGGLRILDRIEQRGYNVLERRPKLGPIDALPILWRAVGMHQRLAGRQSKAA